MPPWAIGCSCFTFCCTWAMLPSGDLWPHNVHHHRPSLPHSLRCCIPHGHTSLAPACGYAALALPLISRTCTLVQHHREHYPYSPSGQLGKCTPRCQPQSMPPRPANGSSLPVTPFQCYLVNATWWPIHCFPVFHWGPHQEDTATWYHRLCGGPWLPPFIGASGSSICWVSCWLCQLSCYSHCLLNLGLGR